MQVRITSFLINLISNFSKSNVKLSRYLHPGDKGERRYSFYSFLTSALDGVECSVIITLLYFLFLYLSPY